jgi:hypothetical protein
VYHIKTITGPLYPFKHRVVGNIFLGLKWLEHEVFHLLPSSAEVKNVLTCT